MTEEYMPPKFHQPEKKILSFLHLGNVMCWFTQWVDCNFDIHYSKLWSRAQPYGERF